MVLAMAVGLTSSALAWEAIRWGSSGGAWIPTQEREIIILASGTYKFYATAGGAGGDLAEINSVFADADIPAGVVTVSIVRDPATSSDPNGCTALGGIDLGAASESDIPECRVQADAATITGLTFNTLSGPLTVGGDIDHAVTITTVTAAGSLTAAGDIAGAVTIESLSGDITCHGLGDCTATIGTSDPEIGIATDYAGTMILDGGRMSFLYFSGGVSGSVTCGPRVAGGVFITGDVSGTVDLIGDTVMASAGVYVIGNVTGTLVVRSPAAAIGITGNVGGLARAKRSFGGLQCGGNVTGTIEIGEDGSIVNDVTQIGGDLLGVVDIKKPLTGGSVRVLGSFGSGSDPGEIYLREGIVTSNANSFVCINYDGYGDSDNWQSGSFVQIVSTQYAGPNAGQRLYAATHCKGDMNSNGAVDFPDIDIFVDALGDDFAGAYPPHAGSSRYHGDIACGCDGHVTFADIDPFVQRLGKPCSPMCDGPCGEEEGLLGGLSLAATSGGATGLGAPYVADTFATHVAPERYGALLDAVIDVAAFPPVTPITDWAQVAALLSAD